MENCKARTKSGSRCKLKANESGYCHLHDPERIKQREREQKRLEEFRFELPKKKFSERKGFVEVSQMIQTDHMSSQLRNSLWNVLSQSFLRSYGSNSFSWSGDSFYGKNIEKFFEDLWIDFYKRPIDHIPENNQKKVQSTFATFMKFEWFEVYDFTEYVINYFASPSLVEQINSVLERELAGYRFIGGVISEITDREEVQMLSEAIADSDFPSVSAHLERALALLSNRKSPDYRNSIKESISAVESLAKIIVHTPKASLGDALKALESKGELHPALKQSFLSLYGYTSNADGIRHAMLDEPNLSAADAKFFLLSCTSFINYLKSKI